MGKVVVSEFVSLDGVMEDPGGAEDFALGGWSFKFDRGPEGDKFKLDEALAADCLLLGRRTYEGFAAVWPNVKDEAGFANKMNGLPKFVVSSTLEQADWNNSTILRGDLAAEVAALKTRFQGEIVVAGSAQLVNGLLQLRLVDELRLMVHPVVLGAGKKLFAAAAEPCWLRLVSSRPAGETLIQIYEPKTAE